jgi:hypothetical protein
MVPVQGFLTSLMRVESHPIRQALQRMKVDIDANDMVDLDALDQDKLKAELKKGA